MTVCFHSKQAIQSSWPPRVSLKMKAAFTSFFYKMLLVQLKRRACQLAFVNVSCYHVTNPLNNFAAAFQL